MVKEHTLSRRTALRLAGAAGGLALAGGLTRGPRPIRAQQPQLPQTTASWTRLFPDVWQFTFGGYNTLAIVTDAGVIATDPISLNNGQTATIFKAFIRSVTERPVTHLVYSHDHADHITGGAVFADTAQVISHELAAPKIAARDDARTPTPSVTFAERMTLEAGGATVELLYTGRNHSDNSLVLHYPARRLLFAVDFIPVRSLPFRNLSDSFVREWMDSLRWIEGNLDFDVLVPGHGDRGTMADVTAMRVYFEDLIAAIRAARGAGHADNSPEMVESVRAALAARYSTWANWGPYLPENIQGVIAADAL